ncbi:MAG: hypothetical protein E6K77_00285 [Candidatus Eisenbacteria bacterium]|uniref:Uncharacterized protein n=1 Tax=Eiseniibacteriota bacterium TaxID=2212470 RepID=A0A538TTU0_UNCEI|nr:MAG: hypothetical protein E6K77_00285 [Candidatus Eisenbacteria bacterium]
MNDFIHSLLSLNWGDPRVLAFLVAIVIVAMARKWSFVVLIVLIVTLPEGLQYLLRHSSLGHDFTHGVVIGVYGFGGLLLLFLAIAHAFTKE